MGSRAAQQHHVAEDAGKAVEVLVLQPRGGRPREHLDGQHIAALDQVGGEVELAGGEGVAAIANPLTVQPDRQGRLGTVEDDGQLLAVGQRGLQFEAGAIARHRVVALRHLPDLELLMTVPGVLGVGVLRSIPPFELDVGRYRDGVPAGVVQVNGLEAGHRLGGVHGVVEAPASVEALLEAADPGGGLLGRREPAVVGMGRDAVLAEVLGIGEAIAVEGHLTAPVMPSVKARCKRRKSTMVRRDAMSTASISMP